MGYYDENGKHHHGRKPRPGRGVTLSQRHGVNPSVMLCFLCQESMGVALLGLLPGDQEAPRQGVFDHEPCDTCKEYMAQGIILISTRDEDEGSDNPYRTGGWCVVTEEAIRRMVDDEMAEVICLKRMAFVPDDAWAMLGLPSAPATEADGG